MTEAKRFMRQLRGGREMTLGDALRSFRMCEEWSAGDLAERAGVDAAEIRGIESGAVKPSAMTAVRLAEAFSDYDVLSTWLRMAKDKPR